MSGSAKVLVYTQVKVHLSYGFMVNAETVSNKELYGIHDLTVPDCMQTNTIHSSYHNHKIVYHNHPFSHKTIESHV